MLKLSQIRLPYREDKLFSILAFLALVAPLAFTIYTAENFEAVKYSLWLILIGCALLAVILKKGSLVLKINRPFFLFLAVLVLAAASSAIFAPDKLYGFFGFYYRFTNGFLFLFSWALLVVLLLSALDWLKYQYLCKILVFTALVVSFFGILQSLGLAFYGGLEPGGFLRAPSLLGNPDFSGMFVVCCLPFAAALFFTGKSFPAKLYYGLSIFIMVCAVVLFSSRGAWLALLVGLLFGGFLIGFSRFSKKALVSGLAVLLLFGLLVYGLLHSTASRDLRLTLNFTDNNVTDRLFAWEMAGESLLQHPLAGSGLGNFQIFFERNRGKVLADVGGVFDDPHNLFLFLGATGGWPLLLSFLGLLGAAAYAGLRQLLEEHNDLLLANLVALSAFVIAACFTPVPIPSFLLLAVILAGLILPQSKEFAYFLSSRPDYAKASSGTAESNTIVFDKRPARRSLGEGGRDPLNESRMNKGFLDKLGMTTIKILISALGVIFILAGSGFLIAEHLFFFGRRAYFEQNFQRSLTLNNLAIKINPTNVHYYIYRAAAHILAKADASIIEQNLSSLAALHPQETGVYVSASDLYHIWYNQDKNPRHLDGAVASMISALRFDPFYAERHARMGLYYYQQGNFPSAREALQFSLSLNPRQFSAWIMLAKIYQQEKNRPAMLYSLEKAYKLEPLLPQMRYLWRVAQIAEDPGQVPIDFVVPEGSLD